MKSVLIAAAMSLFFISSSATAADSGIYLGAGFASGKLSACDNTTSSCNTFTANAQDSGHLRLIGGYDFNKYFGIEAGLAEMGTYKVQNTALVTVGTVKASALTLAAKGGYAFQSGFSVFGKLGLASVRTKYTADPGWTFTGNPDQNSTGVVFGFGGQYNFNRTLGIRLNEEIIVLKDDNYTGVVGGVNLLAILKF